MVDKVSDFAGVWYLDGRSVEPELLHKISTALDGRGIAPAKVWLGDDIAIVHRQHIFTPEDAQEAMPCVGACGAVLAADVNLVARQDLARELQVVSTTPLPPDGTLLLEALQRWDIAAMKRIYGSYALALYHPKRRRLLLARDPVGLRSLFVHRGSRMIAFSTRLKTLLELPEISTKLDEQALADYMVGSRAHPSRTIYHAIDRVPMAHTVVFTPQTTRSERWWSPPEAGSLCLRSDAEVEEAATEILDRAVLDALRAKGPVATCLTGGLDSGSVALSAARQLAPAPLLTLTRVPQASTAAPNQTHYYDESPRARLLAACHAGIEWHAVGDDAGDWSEHDAERWWQESGHPTSSPLNMAWFFPLYRFMHARGARVLMGGELGNAFFSYDGMLRLPQLLRQGQWRILSSQIVALANSEGLSIRKTIQRYLLRPFAPMTLLRLWHSLPADVWTQNTALQPTLAQKLGMRQRLDMSRYRLRLGTHHSLATVRDWQLGNAPATDLWGTLRALSGVDIRMPLGDRRVIEFFGALPLDQFLRDGVSRSLARRLMAARDVPVQVYANRAVGVQHGDWFAHLSRQRPALQKQLNALRDSDLARRVVDLPRLQGLLDRWPNDATQAEPQRLDYLHMLMQGIQMGGFLAWRERAER